MEYTKNFSLEKPDNGDLTDSWDQPLNENADKIDSILDYLYKSINAAKGNVADTTALDVSSLFTGSADALALRLSNAMENDGTPKPTPSAIYASYDRLFGKLQGNFEALARLGQVLYWASQGEVDENSSSQPDRLRKEIGKRGDYQRNSIQSGNLSVSISGGVPTVQPTGDVEIDISGSTYRIRRSQQSVSPQLSGKSTAFVYAQVGTDTEKNIYSANDGELANDGEVWNKISSPSIAGFANARVGDIVRMASNPNFGSFDIQGDYLIKAISGDVITIMGSFPVPLTFSSIAGLSFTVIDPWAVKIDHKEVAVSATEYSTVNPAIATSDDVCFLGEIHYDGSVVQQSFTYRQRGVYDSGWLNAPLISGNNAPQVGGDHLVGPGFPSWHPVGSRISSPLSISFLTGRQDGNGNIYDVQELSPNSLIGGSSAPPAGTSGYFGWTSRKSYGFVYGVKKNTGSEYAYSRKSESVGFPNDASDDASLESVQANAVYRIIIKRS